jgi:hypothetical protein
MATALDLINAAGRLIGELRAGRTFSDAENTDMLGALNQMLGEWSEEQFAIYQISRDQLTLTGLETYTMGPGGTLATTRPTRITAASAQTTAGTSNDVAIVDANAWSARVYDIAETGLFVELLFPDYAFPLVTLRTWPRPPTGSLILYSFKPLTEFATLSSVASFPPGYEEAVVYNLATLIAPQFNKRPTEDVINIADRSRLAISKTNAQLLPPAPIPATAA